MNLLLSALLGTIVGILMTIPLGPISLYVAQKTLRHETIKALFVSLGSVLVDIAYCLVITLGLISLAADYIQNIYIQLALCGVLFLYGLKMLFADIHKPLTPAEILEVRNKTNGVWHYSILLGMTMAVANPTLFVSWTAVLSIVSAWGILGSTTFEKMVFSGAAGFGSLSWFITIALFVRSRRHSVSTAFIHNTGRVTALIVIGFAVYFSIHIFRQIYTIA